MTPELNTLRRTIEKDRFGLVAQVLTTREGCTLSAPCPFFQSVTNSGQISSNMSENLYDGLIARYSPSWGAPAAPGSANAPLAALGTVPPPGRPVSGDFPSAASIPPINIMTPEPATPVAQSAPRSAEKSEKPEKEKPENSAPAPARTSPTAATLMPPPPAPAAKPPSPAAKKAAPAAAPKSRAQAPAQTPVQLAPPPPSEDN
jgi:hypothetical protein